ncbi:N-acetyltransferase family protein [Paracoccus sp. p4-l81]|uniref:GNAT family N-acetyltransferase n=1 Tax=unclassified Paracoccus (in: a-proteobacteria) TaxID=2688777 RepID=UPI0035BAE25F
MPTHPSLTIRPLAAKDRADWQRLYTAYHAFYDRPDLPADFYDTAFARLTDPDSGLYARVAQSGDRLVGLVHYLYHAHVWRPEGVCYLQDLFTDAATRGQGVGRALIEAVYAEADRAGCPAVYWLTQEFNYAGRMLYDKVAVRSPFIRYNRPL